MYASQKVRTLPQVNFPANNLNFHWRWRWWDQINAIFLIFFYYTTPAFLPTFTIFYMLYTEIWGTVQCTLILAHFILGAKLTIHNEVSKLPMQSLNLDHVEKSLSIISEASSSSIETISTHTGILEYFNIKE